MCKTLIGSYACHQKHKTIVSFIAASNVINSNWQVALMAPTEILARQHFNLAKKIFPKNLKIEYMTKLSQKLHKALKVDMKISTVNND